MGRHSRNPSYGHRVRQIVSGYYELSWTVDRYYPNSRLRHPTTTSRQTDAAGARRFAKRHGLADPATPKAT